VHEAYCISLVVMKARSGDKNGLSQQEAGRFLKCYEEALRGYTYMEAPGD